MLRRNAFRVELHAMHRQPRMREPHHQLVVGLGDGRQLGRHAGAIDHQRVVARRLERPVDAAKNARALVLDQRQLAMHRHRRAHHRAAEHLPDRLMPETDPEDRNGGRSLADEVEADAGIVRRAGAGREHDGIGLGIDHSLRRDLVVAMHDHLRPQLPQVVEEIEGEAVVVVDQDDHREKPAIFGSFRFKEKQDNPHKRVGRISVA